jgi:hypothetical protein
MIKALHKFEHKEDRWWLWEKLNPWKEIVDVTSSTIGIEMQNMELELRKHELEFTILDFAGQMEYCATHQVVKF